MDVSAYSLFCQRLFRQNEFAIKLGLEAMGAALQSLSPALQSAPHVLIAGTNGKGQCGATLSSIATFAGHRCGLYTSPHLLSFRERIRIDGLPVSEEALLPIGCSILQRFGGLPLPTRLEAYLDPCLCGPGPSQGLTYFELATLMAVSVFARLECSFAVYEVGLGGRLDATNALDPALSIITAIGLDHEQWLGRSLEEIASEKAGIMRPERPVVIGSRTAVDTLLAKAEALQAPAYLIGRDFGLEARDQAYVFWGLGREETFTLSQNLYPFQRDNVATAVCAALLLEEMGRFSTRAFADVVAALESTRWPGRMWSVAPELVAQRLPLVPHLILDAGHNPQGAEHCCAAIAHLQSQDPRPLGLVANACGDKDIAEIARHYARLPDLQATVAAPVENARVLNAEDFCRAAGWPTHCAHATLPEAITALSRELGPNARVLITGSIYLLGEAMAWLGCSDPLRSTTLVRAPHDVAQPDELGTEGLANDFPRHA